jgi:hypothetical protein
MKSRLVIRLFLFMASGAFFGRFVRWDQARWNRLGREAFLSYQEHRFDRYMASPGTGTKYVVILAIFALGLGVLYEGIAYAGDKIIARLFPKKSAGE